MVELTQAIVREILDYDPETGAFTWRKRARKYFTSDHAQAAWNARYAHKAAGAIKPFRGNQFYRIISVFDTKYMAHRIAWLWMVGAWPEAVIDHRDGDGTNNVWTNIRSATRAQNSFNRRPLAPLKGVVFDKQTGKYRATIHANGNTYRLGSFLTAEAAHAAYCAAANRHHGAFARTS